MNRTIFLAASILPAFPGVFSIYFFKEHAMLKRLLSLMPIVLAGLFPALPAAAHYIWIERDEMNHARLYFGEYQDQEREVSGGRLDEIKGPQAWLLDANGKRQELKATRKENHFDLGVAPDRTLPVIAEELGYEVKDWTKHGIGIVKPMFYTRFSPLLGGSTSKPELVLDILPEGGAPNVFIVYSRNVPLAKAKLMVYAPNFWMQERHTDENGRVAITTPWPGQYVLEVIHLEKQAGEFQGQRFEAFRHRATLNFNIPPAPHNK